MKKFFISMPITGVAYKEIEAETEEQALKIFSEKVTIDDITEWEQCEQIIKGNVFYGVMNEMDIQTEE